MAGQEPQERALRVERDLPWLPPGSIVRTILSPVLPPRRLITMAAAFAFHGDQLLLVDLVDRGWLYSRLAVRRVRQIGRLVAAHRPDPARRHACWQAMANGILRCGLHAVGAQTYEGTGGTRA